MTNSQRGTLLDGVVLAANLVAMRPLTGTLTDVLRRANGDDHAAQMLLFALAVALFVLAPIGATLKRWHYHKRRREETGERREDLGCLFNPIFYFCLVAVIFAAINAFVLQQVYGRREPSGAVFVGSLFGGLALIIAHTILVYRYFTPPKHPPRSPFMRSPASGLLGDAALYANMLLFQLIWNMLSFAGVGAPSGVVEAIARLLIFGFLALLLYFPPRMFYLADDVKKPLTWVIIVAANAPVMWRLIGG